MAGAIGGIIGANLRTTITAWIAAAVFGMAAIARQATIVHTFLNRGMAIGALPMASRIAALVEKR